MTLGQRIQKLRKQHNLSQEALGEKLGVSRQAISRWEMDGAVPEIDKLIALSKLFGMPVGQLLGVECPGGEEQAEQKELTERELEVARAVADRYLEGERVHRERWKKALWLGIALATVLALTLGVYLFQTYDRLERLASRLNGVEYQMNSINSSIDSQVSSALSRMETMLAQRQDSLVERWDYTLERVETGGLCTLTVEVVPRTYEAGMGAVLTLTPEGGQTVSVQGEWDGRAFRFQPELRSSFHVEVMLSLVGADGSQQTQELEPMTGLDSRTQLDVSVLVGEKPQGWGSDSENWEGSYEISWEVGYAGVDECLDLRPVRLLLRLVKNGKVEEEREVPMEPLSDSCKYLAETLWEDKLQLEQEGDEYVLDWLLEDSIGQHYQGEIFRFNVVQVKRGLEAREEAINTEAVPFF